jgi:hypothetical protein
VADFDSDGLTDVAAGDEDGVIYVLLNQGGGTFKDSSPVFPFSRVGCMTAADLNGDGSMDLASAGDSPRVAVLFNTGKAAFGMPVDLPLDEVPDQLASVDLGGDGDMDLISANQLGNLTVFLNQGKGAFGTPYSFMVPGHGSRALAVADFDADGDPDLAVDRANESNPSETLAILFQGPPPWGGTGECPIGRPKFHRGDPNLDGLTDISDALYLLTFLFGNGPPLSCLESADANNSGALDVTDAIFVLSFLFLGTAPPPSPGPPTSPCGPDSDPLWSPGDLGCSSYRICASSG